MVLLQSSSYSSSVRHWRCHCGIKTSKICERRGLPGRIRREKRRRVVFAGASSAHGGGGEGTGFSSDEVPVAPDPALSSLSPYRILGVNPSCSYSELKAAFRQKVKEFHPDVLKNMKKPDQMIKLVIHAYELLSKHHYPVNNERDSLDPFEHPECEACDVFVNEILCIGKGCPNSCIKTAPHTFSFRSGGCTAFASSQGHGDDYQVMLAAGQCPRRCIHYVTPSQKIILEELICRILDSPYDPAEIAFLESLIIQATFENNRYQKSKSGPRASSEFVDWY